MSMLVALLLSAVAPEQIDCLAKNESPTGETDRAAFYLNSEKIKKAVPGFNIYDNNPVLHLELSELGRAEFIEFQKDRVGKSIALCLGNKLLAEPRLQEMIYGDALEVSGFSVEETNALAMQLHQTEAP